MAEADAQWYRRVRSLAEDAINGDAHGAYDMELVDQAIMEEEEALEDHEAGDDRHAIIVEAVHENPGAHFALNMCKYFEMKLN